MIEIIDVGRRFGSKEALKHINMTIPDGETLVIIGGSGSGKSTLMRLLIGLDRPTSGRIIIDGVDVTQLDDVAWDKLRLKMGMVFQYSALFDSMTVGDNVAFALREHTDYSEAKISEIVAEKLEIVGLGGMEKMMPQELSGGMKKRVSLARAIANDPKVIFYDEPCSGLDPIMTDKIDELIVDTQKRTHVTSVVVTHDMGSAFHIADRIAMIYEGELIALDKPAALLHMDDPRVRAFFHSLQSMKEAAE